MLKWLREPLLHFLLLGAGLFLLYGKVGGSANGTGTSIVITSGRIEQLTVNYQRMHQRLPNAAELEELILLSERSLKVGDFGEVERGHLAGTVRQINIRNTIITTPDSIDVAVPNSEFVNGRVTNWTMLDAHARIHVPFGIAYGTNLELVRQGGLRGGRPGEVHAEGRQRPGAAAVAGQLRREPSRVRCGPSPLDPLADAGRHDCACGSSSCQLWR
jgi:hypothetical protein